MNKYTSRLFLILLLLSNFTIIGCSINFDEITRFDGYHFLQKSLQTAIKNKFRVTPQRLQEIKNNSINEKNLLGKDLEKFISNELEQIFKSSLPEIINISNRFNLLTSSQAITISNFRVYPTNDQLSVLVTIYGAKINNSNSNFEAAPELEKIISFIANINVIKNLSNAIEELQLIYVEINDTDDDQRIKENVKNRIINKLMEITNLPKDEIKIKITKSGNTNINNVFYIISSDKINLEFPEKEIRVIFKRKLTLEGFIINKGNDLFYQTKIITTTSELDEIKQAITNKIQKLALSYFFESFIEIDLSQITIELLSKIGEYEVNITIICQTPQISKSISFKLIVTNS